MGLGWQEDRCGLRTGLCDMDISKGGGGDVSQAQKTPSEIVTAKPESGLTS